MSRYYIKIGATKLNHARLTRFSQRMRKQRGNNCERCGRENGADSIHHFYEKHIYPMFAFESDNVVVLCHNCHEKATAVQRKFPDFGNDFYSAFPTSVLNRLNEFRQRAEKILVEEYTDLHSIETRDKQSIQGSPSIDTFNLPNRPSCDQ